ncbi:MAG TPA: hypothetical protein VF982_03985 [Anaerolineales bacterium]
MNTSLFQTLVAQLLPAEREQVAAELVERLNRQTAELNALVVRFFLEAGYQLNKKPANWGKDERPRAS